MTSKREGNGYIRYGVASLVVMFGLAVGSAPAADRVVLMEEFTSVSCTYCAYAGQALNMLLNNYPDAVALVEYHRGDSYAESWCNTRATFYSAAATPTVWADGMLEDVGASSVSSAYSSYSGFYNQRQATSTDVTIDLGGLMSDQTVTVSATVGVESGGVARDLRIYIVEVLDGYPDDPTYSRNTLRQAASTADIHVEPGGSEVVERALTLDATSWANQDDVRIIAWAQAQNGSATANVYQAAVMAWPFIMDCNDNGVGDSEDISLGYSDDCDGDGVPDECQPGGDQDCDEDGESDMCELFLGASDCNANLVPDSCELDAGTAFDCDGNGVLDECDLEPVPWSHDSGVLSPIGIDSPQSYVITDPPVAETDVTLTVTALANLGGSSEYLRLYVNGVQVGTVFDDEREDCTEDQDQLTVSLANWVAAAGAGDVTVTVETSVFVQTYGCSPDDTWVTVTTSYGEPSDVPDLNDNGVPDVCERGDMNCDDSINFDDIDGFVLALVGEAAYNADPEYADCEWIYGDCDFSGTVNFDDIDPFVVLLIQ